MKKKLICILILILLLSTLTACGAQEAAGAPTPEPTAAPPVPSLNAVLPGAETPAASDAPVDETPAVDEALLEAARACIDREVAELYDAIGEPLDSSYAPSCLVPGGQDGELYYEGFTVATYRDGEKEIVLDVNINVK